MVERGTPKSVGNESYVVEELLRQYAKTRDSRLRERLVFIHQGLVRSIATKFTGRGEPMEDLVQVGTIGLINATPTIIGTIRRHFRDKTWVIKVPRKLRERSLAASKANETLSQELGRPPTIQEIAREIGLSEEEVLRAIEAGNAHTPISLERTLVVSEENLPLSLIEIVGGKIDAPVLDIEKYGDIVTAIDRLNTRERLIINLRFFKDMSQTETARKLNISQMHVSRLQKMAIRHLKWLMTNMVDV